MKTAHGPRGAEAKHPIYIYKFCPSDGSMVLLNVSTGAQESKNDTSTPLINPAFTRFNPRINVVYTCTEDVLNNGVIVAYKINEQGALQHIGSVDAGGTSTCYITIDSSETHLIATNYWNSTLTVIPICYETGAFLGPIQSTYDPKGTIGSSTTKMQAAAKIHGGVNHSNNDASTIQERQKDPHSHALVLDPFKGCIAYVPDLGKDLIRELYYDRRKGKIVSQVNVLPSGLSAAGNSNTNSKPDGPRYIEFHPKYDIAYVVNELSCTISVFSVDRAAIDALSKIDAVDDTKLASFTNAAPTLKLIQSIKTVPDAFPTSMNTCGRVTVHPSGNFVIVSNRGHESIAIFRVCPRKGSTQGHLRNVGFFHTYGETPRHFQFDASGQYLIVANQDSNSIAVFSFNLSSGEIKFTGNKYRVPSPNFVCNCIVQDDTAMSGDVGVSVSASSSVEDDGCYDDNNHNQNQAQHNGEVMIHVNPNHEATATAASSTVLSQEELVLELCKARDEIRLLKARLGE